MKPSILLILTICTIIHAADVQGQTLSIARSGKDSLLATGIAAYIDGRHAHAVMALKELGDSSAQAAYYLGSAYTALGDHQAAGKALKRAVELSPSQWTYRVQLARVLMQIGRPEEAEKEYRQVLAGDSMNVASLTNLGALLMDRHAYRDGAAMLAQAAELNPRNALLYYQLGSAMVHLHMPDSARTFLSTSIALNTGYVPALTLLGSLYYDSKEYADALRMYAAAAERNRFAADLWCKVGLCQEKLSDFAAARKAFLKAVEIDSTYEYAFAHLGQACFKLDLIDSAIAAYQHAAALDDQNPLYHINLGIAWAHKDSVEQAVRSYRSAVHAYRPEDIGKVYERLGVLRFSKKQFREARDSYLKALQFDPTSGTIPLSLALTYDHLKQYKAAVTWYRKFLRAASSDPDMAKQVKETEARLKVLTPKIARAQN